jgi:DNA polymerase-3 subunit epsilon
MKNFTAIDFEPASGYRNSIFQVGLVRVENGITTKEVNQLVQPSNNYYWSCFTNIHGIAAKDSTIAPTFDQIWQQSMLYIENQNVIAHNGFGFDFPVLDKTLDYRNFTHCRLQ